MRFFAWLVKQEIFIDVFEFAFNSTGENAKALTLEPLRDDDIPPHKLSFINELKIADFKQVLMKNNVHAEMSNGTLWCANSTIAIRRVSFFLALLTFSHAGD